MNNECKEWHSNGIKLTNSFSNCDYVYGKWLVIEFKTHNKEMKFRVKYLIKMDEVDIKILNMANRIE